MELFLKLLRLISLSFIEPFSIFIFKLHYVIEAVLFLRQYYMIHTDVNDYY